MIKTCPICSKDLYIWTERLTQIIYTCGKDEFTCHFEFDKNEITINNKVNLIWQSAVSDNDDKEAVYRIDYNKVDILETTTVAFHNKVYEMLENNNFSFFKLKLFIKNIESNLIFI